MFIIDEISMVPRYALEIIDKKLRELMKPYGYLGNLPFGGKIVIIGGDFRQILPIERHALRSELVSLSIRFSYLWDYFKVFRLNINKRATTYSDKDINVPDKMNYAEFILKMGNGELPTDEDGYIDIPEFLVSKGDLIDEIFSDYIKN